MINFVAAHGKKRELGYQGRLPWPRMAADIQRLHNLIDNQIIVMGEQTYREYRHVKHAFHSKRVFVLSSKNVDDDDVETIYSIEDVLSLAKKSTLWVIGGAKVFQQLLPYAQTMYLTCIDGNFKADSFFPSYDSRDWEVIDEQSFSADGDNPFDYSFLTLKRK